MAHPTDPTVVRLSIYGPDGRLVTACDLTVYPWHHGGGQWKAWLKRVAPRWLARAQDDPEGAHVATVQAVGDDQGLTELAHVTLSDTLVKAAAAEREQEVRDNITRHLVADSKVCTCYPHPSDHEDGCPKRAKPAHIGPGRPPSELPDWAIIQLSERGMDAGDVTHFIGDPNGRTIAAAIDGKPVRLARP